MRHVQKARSAIRNAASMVAAMTKPALKARSAIRNAASMVAAMTKPALKARSATRNAVSNHFVKIIRPV
jgi:hypothetical protein